MTRFIGRELQYLAEYDFDGRNEAEISGDWIETLLRLLGYGPSTRHEIRRQQDLPLRPPTRMVGSHRIKIDFVPTVFGRRLWIIEAKGPKRISSLLSTLDRLGPMLRTRASTFR